MNGTIGIGMGRVGLVCVSCLDFEVSGCNFFIWQDTTNIPIRGDQMAVAVVKTPHGIGAVIVDLVKRLLRGRLKNLHQIGKYT